RDVFEDLVVERSDAREPATSDERGGRAPQAGQKDVRVAITRRIDVSLDERFDVTLTPTIARERELRFDHRASDVVERHRMGGVRVFGGFDAFAELATRASCEGLDLLGLFVERFALGRVATCEGIGRFVDEMRELLLPQNRDE